MISKINERWKTLTVGGGLSMYVALHDVRNKKVKCRAVGWGRDQQRHKSQKRNIHEPSEAVSLSLEAEFSAAAMTGSECVPRSASASISGMTKR